MYAGAGQAKPSRAKTSPVAPGSRRRGGNHRHDRAVHRLRLGDDDKGNDVVALKVVAELEAASPNQAECPDGRRFFTMPLSAAMPWGRSSR